MTDDKLAIKSVSTTMGKISTESMCCSCLKIRKTRLWKEYLALALVER